MAGKAVTPAVLTNGSKYTVTLSHGSYKSVITGANANGKSGFHAIILEGKITTSFNGVIGVASKADSIPDNTSLNIYNGGYTFKANEPFIMVGSCSSTQNSFYVNMLYAASSGSVSITCYLSLIIF